MKKLLIFSAPSGSGKTTIVRRLMARFGQLEFSVSATSRAPRGREVDGRDYHFVSPEKFANLVSANEFVEWEEVYAGTCYGTLRSEIEAIWARGNVAVFDVDVMGGVRLKNIFGSDVMSFFISAPSVEELRNRLEKRGTETPDNIEKRLSKAASESAMAPKFDHIIVNDVLERAVDEIAVIIEPFIAKNDARK